MTDVVIPRPAAAVVLVRNHESGGIQVFMVRRHTKSTFMPDVYVFPGGSLAESDSALELVEGACAPAGGGPTRLGTGFRAAAIRECFEEAGVLLARQFGSATIADRATVLSVDHYRRLLQQREPVMQSLVDAAHVQLATDELTYWAHWITPDTLPVRFDTQFFLAAMPPSQDASFDDIETSDETWISPFDALTRFAYGDFPLVIATKCQLEQLSRFESIADAIAGFANCEVQTTRPRIVESGGVEEVIIEEFAPS